MPLQSHEGCTSCIRRTTSFNTSSSCPPEAASASTSDLRSSRSPVFSLIDGILPYLERLPPMITPPRKEIPKPDAKSRGLPVGAVREPPTYEPLYPEKNPDVSHTRMTPSVVGSCVTLISFQLWRAPSLIASCSAASEEPASPASSAAYCA